MAPAQVRITFDESVGLGLGYLRVVNSDGADVGSGPAVHPDGAGEVISTPLKPDLPGGTYIASWRVISADSHPVQGTIRFVVGNDVLSTAAATVAPVVATSTSVTFDIARCVSFASLAVLGGAWLLLSIWPAGRRNHNARRMLILGWVAGLVGAAGEMLLQGPYAAGAGLAGVGRFGLFTETIDTNYGRLHLIRMFLLALIGVGLQALFVPAPGRPLLRRSLPWVGLFLGVAYTFSAAGHAGVARPRWLAVSSDMTHLIAMSVWIGGLVLLVVAVLPARDAVDLRSALPVFSRVASGCVLFIAATGTYQAWRESGTVKALTTTTYGLLVLVKVVLFLGLVALGNLSRVAIGRRYLPSAQAAADTAAPVSDDSVGTGVSADLDVGRMRRAVLAELGLAAVVLSVTAVLVAQPPGRTAVAATPLASASATTTLEPGRSVTVTVAPARQGTVAVTVTLHGGSDPQLITVTASLPSAQLGPLPVPLTAAGALTYHSTGVLLPAAGLWTFAIEVQSSEFHAITTSTQIAIS